MGVSRQAALLARLTMEPQRQVPASALIAAAWGPDVQVTAASLDSQLWRLRNRLDPERGRTSVLVREGSGYRLHLDPAQVDSAYFEQLTVEVDQLLGDQAAAATLLPLVDRALALWRGRAFEPIADHLDVGPTAARLSERKEQLQERRAELLMRSGQVEAALAEVISLMADAPYRERLWAIRIRALADLGRTDEALASYRAARDLLSDQLGLDPGVELQKLQADILAGGSSKPEVRPTAGSNGDDPGPVVQLPRATTELLGRSRDRQRLSALLAEQSLVTISGPGGCGKTSLAIDIAASMVGAFPGGMWFVDLTTVSHDADVADTVAATLGLSVATTDDTLQQLRHLGDRRELLIVLDNCEQVLVGAAECAAAITGGASAAKVLGTSREPLGVDGEVVWALAPLSLLPVDGSSSIETAPAVRLFLQRAAAVAPDLGFDAEDHAIIETICRGLDGLPLAIELAAARVPMFALAEIAEQVTSDPSRLGRLGRTRNDHRSTLYQAIEWSYRLLPAELQELHRRLSVLPGEFTLAAARGLTEDIEGLDVAQAVATLANQSMLSSRRHGRVTRFAQLETIRAHGRRKVVESGEEPQARHVRDEWVATLLIRRPSLARSAIGDWYDDVEADYPTVQATLQGAVSESGDAALVALGSGLAFFWFFRSRSVEGRSWLAKAVASGHLDSRGLHDVLTQLRLAGGELVTYRPELATPYLSSVLDRSVQLDPGDAGEIAEALLSVAGGAWACQRFDLLEAVGAVLRTIASTSSDADVHLFARVIRCVATRSDEVLDRRRDELTELYDEAIVSDNIIVAWFAALKSSVISPTPIDTMAWAQRVIELHRRLGAGGSRPFLETLANMFASAGDARAAVPIYAATAELARQSGTPWPEHPHTRANFEQSRSAMGRSEFERAWRDGAALTLQDVADRALTP